MRVAHGVVGQLQVLEQVRLSADPHAAIAVLVAGEVLDERHYLRAVRVRGIGKGDMPADGEMAIGPGAAVGHETVKIRMGGVALEFLQRCSTWPGVLADLRAFELTRWMLRQREPETCRIGSRRHV